MLNNKDNDYILLNILIFETYMYVEGGTVRYKTIIHHHRFYLDSSTIIVMVYTVLNSA